MNRLTVSTIYISHRLSWLIRPLSLRLSLKLSLCALLLPILAPGSLAARDYKLVYFEAGSYPVSRTLQGEYRSELQRLAPKGMKIIFPADSYKSADWDREKSRKMAREIARNKSIDLIVAMGPWTVEDLLDAGVKKPIVAMGRFDPVLEGLVAENGRPKHRNLTVRVSPGKIETDMQALTALYPVKKIGLLFFPSNFESKFVEDYIREQAKKVGAELVAIPPTPGESVYPFFKKLNKLKHKVDALYLTPLFGMNLDQLNGFLQSLDHENLPAFSHEGFFQVKRGAFATNSALMLDGLARFHAAKTIRILQGERPSSLPTVFREGRRLGVNLPQCKRFGIELPANLVAEARVIPFPPDPTTPLYSVSSAIEEALRVNPGYLAQAEKTQAEKYRAGEATSAYLPQIIAEGFLREFDEPAPVNSVGRFRDARRGFDVTVSQKIFDWQSLKEISAARKRVEVARQSESAARVEFEYAVALAFLELARAQEIEATHRSHRERIYQGLQEALTRFQLEEGTRFDLMRWEQEKEFASGELSSTLAGLQAARANFLALLARPVRDEFVIDQSQFSSDRWLGTRAKPDPLESEKSRESAEEFWALESLRVSPLMQLSQATIASRRAQISVNSGSFLPSLGVSGGYFSDESFDLAPPFEFDNQGWRVEAQIRLPIFEGGQRFKERSRLRAELSALGYQQDQLSMELVRRARVNFSKMVGAYDRYLFALRGKRMASAAQDESLVAYKTGEITLIEAQTQIAQTLRAELEAIESRYQYWASELALWKDVGYGYLPPGENRTIELNRRLAAYLAR